MSQADHCQHCGCRLPAFRDAFCPECREDLSEPAATIASPRESSNCPPVPPEIIADCDRKASWYGAVLSATIFVCFLVMILLEGESELVIAWGREPLGLPPRIFAASLFVLVFIPIPWFLYHLSRIARFAFLEGRLLTGTIGIFVYISTVSLRAPHLANSVGACGKGAIYILCLIAAHWVWHIYRLG